MFKPILIVALCTFALVQCLRAGEGAVHERVRRQSPGDLLQIPAKAAADWVHTWTGMAENVVNGGAGGSGGATIPRN